MGQNDPGADEHTGCDVFVDTVHADEAGPAVAAPGVVVPSGHSVQLNEPETLHVPLPHGIADALYEPAGHANPGGHRPEHVETVKPAEPPNVPAGHSVHDDAFKDPPK